MPWCFVVSIYLSLQCYNVKVHIIGGGPLDVFGSQPDAEKRESMQTILIGIFSDCGVAARAPCYMLYVEQWNSPY